MARERAEQVAPDALAALAQRALVVAPGPLELGGELLVAAGAQPGGVLAVRLAATSRRRSAAKRSAIPGASSWSHSTGVSDSVSGAPVVEQVEQRQVAARDRLPQPLLAERPGAEALDVGHVRVQDDRQRAARAARGAHGRHTARRSSARVAGRASAPGRSAKSARAIAGVKRS